MKILDPKVVAALDALERLPVLATAAAVGREYMPLVTAVFAAYAGNRGFQDSLLRTTEDVDHPGHLLLSILDGREVPYLRFDVALRYRDGLDRESALIGLKYAAEAGRVVAARVAAAA